MTKESRKPDWRKWRQMPYWKLWEAVALSLDIEPNKIKLNKHAWMGADHPFAESLTVDDHAFTESLTFNEGLEILRRNVGGAQGLTVKRGIHWYEATVNTREFAAWAKQSEWNVPPELEEIARGPSGAAASKLERKGEIGKPAPDAPQPPVNTEKVWKVEARRLALAYLTRHWQRDLHPSQPDVSNCVAEQMRTAKFYGPQGKPLSARYIQRNAIQGEWWRNVKRETREK